MEMSTEQYYKECMKLSILKHEETFRQQVHELHRLYRVQKILMDDLKNKELKRQRMLARSRTDLERWNTESETASPQPYYSYRDQRRPRKTLDLELPAEKYIGEDEGDTPLNVEEENQLELTLAIGSRRKKEAMLTSDSATSFSSSSAEYCGVKLNGHEWKLSFQGDRENVFNVEEQMRQDRVKHPSWLFPCLSLNMT